MEPLLEGVPYSAGLPASSLRRTMSEKLADLEAAQKAHLEDTRVTPTSSLVRHNGLSMLNVLYY